MSIMPAFHATPNDPRTPIRRAITAIFRSASQPISQPPPHSNSTIDRARPIVSDPALYTSLPAVALQTSSQSTDGIIITSLQRAPFCCHEDLITMPRSDLVRVAQNINGRLPKALQIACGDDLHSADIRRAIEVLAGIKPEIGTSSIPTLCSSGVMQAMSLSAALVDDVPLDTDVSLSDADDQTNMICSSPVSIRRSPLEILKEEQEYDEPFKHGRTSPENSHGPMSTSSGSRLVENLDMSASRLLSFDSSENIHPLTNTKQNVHRRRGIRLSGRSLLPREVMIRLPFTSPPKAQHPHILRSHSQRTSTNSTSTPVSTLKRAKSDATVLLKRPNHQFKRGPSTSKGVNRINVPTRSALIDLLTPKPHIESTFMTVTQGKNATGAGAVKAMSEMVV